MAVFGCVALTHVPPALGHPVFVVQSGSMSPAIPVGATVVDSPVDVSALSPGDVVTMRLANGVIFTHRVTRLVRTDAGAYVETEGDANASVDPALTPVDEVVGRVDVAIPFAGFAVAFLAQPSGIATVILLALTILVAVMLLEDDQGLESGAEEARAPGDPLTDADPADDGYALA
jgi:signal peptidase